MNVTIGIWALVVGGWVLPSSDDMGFNSPSDQRDVVSIDTPPPETPAKPPVDKTPVYPGRGTGLTRGTGPRPGGTMPQMPTAPTDSSGDPSIGMPVAPTGQTTPRLGLRTPTLSKYGLTSAGSSPSPFAMPDTPTAAAPSYGAGTGPGASYGGAGPSRPPAVAPAYPANPSAAYGARPFSGYTPSPTSSPYMHLWDNTTNGAISNYQQRVQPLLRQQSLNNQINGEIQGLEGTAQLQRSPQQMPQDMPVQQGFINPQSQINYMNPYMNTQNYYPGAPR